jgi:tRNA pseudouridine(38-40) synthase
MSPQSSFTHRYALRLSYHGANFLGWQRQAAGRTVQESLESALATWLRSEVEVLGVGRTDSGVHALKTYLSGDLSLESIQIVTMVAIIHFTFVLSAIGISFAERLTREKE